MKILILTIVAGPNGNYQPGNDPEVDDKFGQDLINGGYAKEIKVSHETLEDTGHDLGPDYTKMKKDDLELLCMERDIEAPDGARKTDLIGLLEAYDNK